MKLALFIHATDAEPMIIAIVTDILLIQVFDDFFDGINAMDDEVLAKQMPSGVLAALDPDIDDDEGFPEMPTRQPIG